MVHLTPWHTNTIVHLTLPPDRNTAMGQQKEQRLCSPVLCKCKMHGTGVLALALEEGAVVRRPLLQPPPFLKSHSIGMQGRWWEQSAEDCHNFFYCIGNVFNWHDYAIWQCSLKAPGQNFLDEACVGNSSSSSSSNILFEWHGRRLLHSVTFYKYGVHSWLPWP